MKQHLSNNQKALLEAVGWFQPVKRVRNGFVDRRTNFFSDRAIAALRQRGLIAPKHGTAVGTILVLTDDGRAMCDKLFQKVA